MFNSRSSTTDGTRNGCHSHHLTADDLWPLSEKDLERMFAFHQEKVLSLDAYAARFVFEQYCKERPRHSVSVCLPAVTPNDTSGAPFPRQIGKRSFFCGRESDLNTLSRYFNKDLKQGRPRIKVISGYGGLGKTQVSFQYAYNNRKKYPSGVFYFYLESLRTFHDSVKDNIVTLGLVSIGSVSQDFEKLQATLRGWPKCLFIYDGADRLVEFNDYIPSIAVDVIITTRMATFDHPQLGSNSILTLKVLDIIASVQLLTCNFDGQIKTVDEFQKECPEDYEYAKKIVGKQCLDGLPLALLHASSFKKSQGPSFSFKNLWEKLQEDMSILSLNPASLREWLKNYDLKHIGSRLKDLHLESLNDLKHLSQQRLDLSDLTAEEKQELLKARDELVRAPAHITWRLDIGASCQKAPHNLGYDILRLSAMLPSNDIPEDVLVRGVAQRNSEYTETDIREAIHHVYSHSLLTDRDASYPVKHNQPVQVRTFAMHPMIQCSVAKYLMAGDIQNKVLICLGAVLCTILPSDTEFQKESKLTDDNVKRLTPHLYHIALAIAKSPKPFQNCWQRRTLALACICAIRLLDAEVGLILCKRHLKETLKNKDELPAALVQVGYCHAVLLEPESASMYFEKAIDLLGDLPPDKALPAVERWGQALFEIIRGYRLVYAMERVESIAEKMRKGLEWAGARECQSYARCLNSIAVCHCRRARNADEVIGLSKLALGVYRNSLPEPHPNIATELANIGFYYWDQGIYPEAEKYALQSLEMRKMCDPANHYTVTYSLWLLGVIYLDWGQYKRAGFYLGKAAAVVESSSINFTTIYTLQALAEWQALVKNKCEAEKNQEKALEMVERVIGPYHRNSKADAIYKSGRCLMALGNYQEAEECLNNAKDLLENVPEDNYVLLKVNLLQGQCLVAQDRYSEAQSLLEQVYSVLDLDSLKSRHLPQRGETLHYLGICLLHQKKNKEAEPLLREAVELRKAVLVENDKRTVDTCRVLKDCLESLEKHEEARKLLELAMFMESHNNELNYDSVTDSASTGSTVQTLVQGNSGWYTMTSLLCGFAIPFLVILIGIFLSVLFNIQ